MKLNSESEAAEFFIRAGCECVLKPVQGSGSEHVFKCSTADKCKEAFREIAKNQASPVAVAEKFIQGTEYSCDFIIDGSKIHLIRIARKLPSDNNVFGTTMGYELIEFLPGNISHTYFISMLEKAAKSVGINRAICMMDFIVRGSMIYILELAPRPGGDCLPWLIEKAMGLDILALTINFVQQKPYIHIKPESFSPMIGLRIHAQKPGILKKIDITGLQADSRVRDVYIKRENGDIIVIPPADYDSWNLGHAIFKPYRFVELEKQCKDLLSLVTIEMENRNDIQYNGIQKAG
jgi:biotin carboxylase